MTIHKGDSSGAIMITRRIINDVDRGVFSRLDHFIGETSCVDGIRVFVEQTVRHRRRTN